MKKQVPYEILLQFSVTVANEIIATPSITGEYHSHHLNMMIFGYIHANVTVA